MTTLDDIAALLSEQNELLRSMIRMQTPAASDVQMEADHMARMILEGRGNELKKIQRDRLMSSKNNRSPKGE